MRIPILGILMFNTMAWAAVPAMAQSNPFVPAMAGAAQTLSTDLFLQPRSGRSLSQVPALRQVVRDWIEGRAQRLTIRYPGGEDGTLWASELRDWLVALGVASANIELLPGTPRPDVLVIEPW